MRVLSWCIINGVRLTLCLAKTLNQFYLCRARVNRQYTDVLNSNHKETPMFTSQRSKPLSTLVMTTLPLVAALAASFNASAAESYKLRQAPVGTFGGDIATPADKPGFFGTASLTQLTIEGIKGPDGGGLTKASPLNSTPLRLVDPRFVGTPLANVQATVGPGSVSLTQDQTQINIAAGYLTETTYANGRIALVANVPLIKQSRTLLLSYPDATFSPNIVPANNAAMVNNAVRTAASNASNTATGDAVGLGDTELSAVWVRHVDRIKVAAGVSVFVPTGKYDVARDVLTQANPGFGNFYTIRPGVAFTYNLNPNYSHQDWDAGVTIAGRFAYGFNTENKDSKYKSGNYIYAEGAVVKVMGDTAIGFNLFSTQQITDDSYSGTDLTKTINGRYKTMGGGPFFSYKIPGQDMGLNFQINRNFSGRNAIDVTSYQLRLIKAF